MIQYTSNNKNNEFFKVFSNNCILFNYFFYFNNNNQIQNFSKFENIEKFMKLDLINIILAFGFVFSIIFMVEMSVTFHVPRYGIFPSILIMFYCNILIFKILEFKKKSPNFFFCITKFLVY